MERDLLGRSSRGSFELHLDKKICGDSAQGGAHHVPGHESLEMQGVPGSQERSVFWVLYSVLRTTKAQPTRYIRSTVCGPSHGVGTVPT
jgi:hypothetical protein